MKVESFFIKEVNQYIKFKEVLEELFHLNKEIPEKVFLKEFKW